eukprot:4508255-Lingulodinium_polyedra.AAC.1
MNRSGMNSVAPLSRDSTSWGDLQSLCAEAKALLPSPTEEVIAAMLERRYDCIESEEELGRWFGLVEHVCIGLLGLPPPDRG